MRCVRSDGSHYGTGGKCRKGIQDEERAWLEPKSKQFPELAGKFEALAEKVADLDPELRKSFNAGLKEGFIPPEFHNWKNEKGETLGKGEKKLPYSQEEKVTAISKQINGWTKLAETGYPKGVKLRDNTLLPPPKGMTPSVTGSGLAIWVRASDKRKFNWKPDGIIRQSRADKSDTTKYIPAIASFKKSQDAKGGSWPTQTLSPRKDIKLDVDHIVNNLTPAQKRAIVANGLPYAGNKNMPGAEVKKYYNSLSKEEKAQKLDGRLRDIVQRYVDQGGRSGISGQPIALPGLEPNVKRGEARSTVDHFNPISGGKGQTPEQVAKKFDVHRNFLLAEEGPNSNRSNTPWDKWLDRETKNSGPETSFVKVPSQSPKRNPYTLSDRPADKSLDKKLDSLLASVRKD